MRMLSFHQIKIVLLSVVAACAYGVAHDQVTIRICLEYFTVAHPPLFAIQSPTFLALCWGIVATIGIGGILGLALALLCEAGPLPPHPRPRVARSILRLLAMMAAAALISGLAGYGLSHRGWIKIPEDLAASIPPSEHHRFMAVWFAHGASYLVGAAGGIALCFGVWNARGRPFAFHLLPRSRGEILRAGFLLAVAAAAFWLRFREG